MNDNFRTPSAYQLSLMIQNLEIMYYIGWLSFLMNKSNNFKKCFLLIMILTAFFGGFS